MRGAREEASVQDVPAEQLTHPLGQLAVTAASLAWAGSLPGFFCVAPAVLVLCLAAGIPRAVARGS